MTLPFDQRPPAKMGLWTALKHEYLTPRALPSTDWLIWEILQ
jgi:hypothetical protein